MQDFLSNKAQVQKIVLKFDGQTTFAAVLPVFVVGHENAGSTNISWAFFSFPLDFTSVVNFVV